MSLVKIDDSVYLDPKEVCSIQREVVSMYTSPSISDHSTKETFNGSIITLKNGRKIAVNGLDPNSIRLILKGTGEPG